MHFLRFDSGKPLCGSREKATIVTDVRSWVTCPRCQRLLEQDKGAR